MRTFEKLALGLLAIAPLLLFVLSFQSMSDFESDAYLYCFYGMFGATLAALVVFIRFLFRRSSVPQDKRKLWLAVLLLGHVLAIPVFWYYYVYRSESR